MKGVTRGILNVILRKDAVRFVSYPLWRLESDIIFNVLYCTSCKALLQTLFWFLKNCPGITN